MTILECRKLFLQYLDEDTINGTPKNDADLLVSFNTFLYPAMLYVSSEYPSKTVVDAPKEWTKPNDFVKIERTFDKVGNPVAYYEIGDKFMFDCACKVEYAKEPTAPTNDTDSLDLPSRACQLVPMKIAIDVALSKPQYSYKVQYLTTQYNSMVEAMIPENIPLIRSSYTI